MPLRKLKYFFNLFLSFLFFIGIFVLSQKLNHRIDLTTQKRHTLSQSTIQELQQLQSELKIDAFLPLSTPIAYQDLIEQWRNLLLDIQREYAQTNLRFFDTAELDENEEKEILERSNHLGVKPQKMILQKADIRLEKTLPFAVVISYLNQSIVLNPPEEISLLEFEFTLALKSLLFHRTKPKIAFTQGHGETDFLKSPLIHRLAQRAELQNIDLSQIKEPIENTELSQIALLLIFAPQYAFKKSELERLNAYIKQGGNLLIAADYRIQSPEFPSVWVMRAYGFEEWLKELGIDIHIREVVVDPLHPALAMLDRDAMGKSSATHHPLYVQTMKPFAFLDHFDALVCPMCPPIEIKNPKCQSLINSFDSAQAHLDLRSLDLNQSKAKRSADINGFSLFASCEFPQSRLVFMGSAHRFLSANATHLLAFEDMIDWLLYLDDMIELKNKNYTFPRLDQKSSSFKSNFKIMALLIPILFLILLQFLFIFMKWRKYR